METYPGERRRVLASRRVGRTPSSSKPGYWRRPPVKKADEVKANEGL